MSRILFYLDEDASSLALLKALRNAGLNAITPADTGRLGYSDEEQLAWARDEGRVIYSFNIKDFCRLHRDWLLSDRNHAGIVLIAQKRYSIGQQIQGLLTLVSEQSAKTMINQLIFLSVYIMEG